MNISYFVCILQLSSSGSTAFLDDANQAEDALCFSDEKSSSNPESPICYSKTASLSDDSLDNMERGGNASNDNITTNSTFEKISK